MVDAHSFPSRPLPYEDDQHLDRPDICVGTDPFHTPPHLRDAAVHFFEAAGWRVAVDRPFSGALVPLRFYGTDARVKSVMVEVNRCLYMNEASGDRLASFDEVAGRLRKALGQLTAQTVELGGALG